MARRALVLGALLALPACAPSWAAAQDACDPQGARGPVEVMPAAGAAGVRLDDPVRITFTDAYFASPSAPLPEESFVLRDADGQEVPGEVQLASDEVLFFLPAGGFQPDMAYTGTAFGEVDLPFGFRTGTDIDQRPPTVSPLSFLGSTRVDPSCAAPAGGFRVDLTFSVSLDDGAPGSIEYHLYLARAEGLEAPVRVARLRNFTSDRDARVPMSFVLDEAYARRAICVQLVVTDGAGNLAEGSPFCFDPVEGANFAGLCSAGPAASGGGGHEGGRAPLLFVLAGVGLACVRRRRVGLAPGGRQQERRGVPTRG